MFFHARGDFLVSFFPVGIGGEHFFEGSGVAGAEKIEKERGGLPFAGGVEVNTVAREGYLGIGFPGVFEGLGHATMNVDDLPAELALVEEPLGVAVEYGGVVVGWDGVVTGFLIVGPWGEDGDLGAVAVGLVTEFDDAFAELPEVDGVEGLVDAAVDAVASDDVVWFGRGEDSNEAFG